MLVCKPAKKPDGQFAHFFMVGIMPVVDTVKMKELLEPAAEAVGYELVDVEIAGRGANTVLRVYIDAPGGITVDDCAEASRHIGAVLDVEDPIAGQYALEVSSPGLDRPLVKPEHFERVIGQKVKVTLREYYMGRRRFSGELTGVTDQAALVDVDGEIYELAFEAMDKARLDPDF
jgi:ribosome maturation factor RimP